MVALTPSSGTAAQPGQGIKFVHVKVLQSAVNTTTGVNPADTFTIDMATYGCTTFWGARGFVHLGLNSDVRPEDASVALSGTVLTFTIAGGNVGGLNTYTTASSKTRTYTLYMA